MDKAGVQAGDFLEAADGYPLNGAANWFLARAHFERDRPIELHVRRGDHELPSTSTVATVAMGPAARAPSAFWNPDRCLSDRNNLRAIRFGHALAGGAFGGPGALDTRYGRRHPFTVSQPVAAVSADHADHIPGGVALRYDSLFRGRLPDPAANCRRLDDGQSRRRASVLLLALAVFAIVVLHNFFVRNWTSWFGSTPPALFSGIGFVGETLLFLFIPPTLAYCVLTEGSHATDNKQRGDN